MHKEPVCWPLRMDHHFIDFKLNSIQIMYPIVFNSFNMRPICTNIVFSVVLVDFIHAQGEMPESIAFTLWGTVGVLVGADGDYGAEVAPGGVMSGLLIWCFGLFGKIKNLFSIL